MLTLYVKDGCPYCHIVQRVREELGLTIEEKNIADPGIIDELIARGGKQQVPYLVDSERGVEMYESEGIARYLREHYAQP